ncbi:PBECR4 domain-containing protein [Enterococcus termitis]
MKKDFDIIKEAFIIYDTNFNNHEFTYTYRHRKTKKILEMKVKFEAGNFMHLCGVKYNQIDKDGKIKFSFSATQFYKALKSNKVSLRGITTKNDGTTGQKLQVIPLLEMLISPGVRVCDGGMFYNMHYEKAIRSGKMIVALTCKENNKRYVPQSLLSLINQPQKSQSKSLTESHEVIKISKTELSSSSITEIYNKC